MLRCWGCFEGFTKKHVLRDSILRARTEADGGPYYLYRCPRCQRESRVERTPRDRLSSSPERDFSPVEYLFAWLPPMNPVDFLKVLQWHYDYAEQRAAFFARDGDGRYLKGGWFRRLRRWLRRGQPRRPSSRPRRERRRQRLEERRREQSSGPPPASTPQPSAPHPYQILGVGQDASTEEIRAAFRKLARTWHPDKIGSEDPASLEEANRRLQQLVEAYEQLIDEREGR